MSRKTAREHSFRILFSALFQKLKPGALIERYYQMLGDRKPSEEKDLLFIDQEVRGALLHQEEIDAYVEGALLDWKLSRLSFADLTILRLAIYEMNWEEDIPVSVSINEAVEFAKAYSSDAAPSFINGVLGSVAKKLGTADEALTKASTEEKAEVIASSAPAADEGSTESAEG